MIFTIDYAPDVTLVKCEEWNTLTIIIRTDIGDLISVDAWCPGHSPDRTDDPHLAVWSALKRAQLCTKDVEYGHIGAEFGDKLGFYYGRHEATQMSMEEIVAGLGGYNG